jgi:hypothetical protein
MITLKPTMSIPGTRLPECYRVERQQGMRAQAWRQHPTAFLGIDVSTPDNSTRVSEVENRHT